MTYSIVHSLVLTTTKGHVGNRALGAVPGSRVLGHKVDTRNHTSVATGTAVVEHLDGVQFGLLSDSVGNGTDCAGTVGAVS